MEVVAHRAGNTVATARAAVGAVDMIELDVHVLHGRVELRHAKVLRPTNRMWEKWYLLPRGSEGVPIDEVLAALDPDVELMIDLKCFTRRAVRLIRSALGETRPLTVSTRSWWTLGVFADRAATRLLQSCGARWQLWWALNRSTFEQDRGVCVHESRLDDRVVAAFRARTGLIFSWGATTAARCVELRDAGVTGLILDDYSIAP